MFNTNSSFCQREFLRNTKSLLTHGSSIQQDLNGLNHTNSRNHVDCIRDKCKIIGRYDASRHTIIGRAQILDNVQELEKSSSLFKHVIPDTVNFLTQMSYGSFTNRQHSSVLKVSLNLTDAQCCCHECCFREKQTPESRKYQVFDEGTVLFEQSFHGLFSYISVAKNLVSIILFYDYLDIQQVIKNFEDFVKNCPQIEVSRNAFLAVCQVIHSTKDLAAINAECEYIGLIGPDNSFLHLLLQQLRLFCVHAAFHDDAFGFMKKRYNLIWDQDMFTHWVRNLYSRTDACWVTPPACFFGCI